MSRIPNFPSKFIQLSSSVIILRPNDVNLKINQSISQSSHSNLDFQILLLKRSPKLSHLPNYFAFPGGKIERQDFVHKWQTNMPQYHNDYLKGGVNRHPDFTKKIAVVRELFEETNILIAKDNQTQFPSKNLILNQEGTRLRDEYLNEYQGNFIKFCKNLNLYPSIEKFYGFTRTGSPIGVSPANDCQFYIYFSDYEPIDSQINLNLNEFTEYKWLGIEEALKMYKDNQIPLFYPQVIILLHLFFLNKNYMDLRKTVENGFSQNILNYLTNKAHIFSFESLVKSYSPNILNGQAEVEKQVKLIFDKSDLLPDKDRQDDMFIYNNEGLMKEFPVLQSLIENQNANKSLKSQTDLIDLFINHGVDIALLYGDFYSTQDNYPFGVADRIQRCRFYIHKQTQKLLRMEISKNYFHLLSSNHSTFLNARL